MILEKKISNYVSIGIAFYFLISLSCCSCKVHKSIQKDYSKYDSSVFANNEQKHISNSEEISNIKKKNDYSKITIELSDSAELPAFLPSNFTTTENKVTLPKGTKIVIETGTQKEISNTNKKVQVDSSQKENSGSKVTRETKTVNKQVDKKGISKWQIVLGCIAIAALFLLIKYRGNVYTFAKKKAQNIFSHIKGWITGV